MTRGEIDPVRLPPYCCAVCGRSFSNEYFHTRGGGDSFRFADFDDRWAGEGYAPGVVGSAWVCREHLEAARQHAKLTMADAIRELRRQFAVEPRLPIEHKSDPELLLLDVGPNRARVFAIVRQATGASPTEARRLLEHLPLRLAEGWPAQLEHWQKALTEAGATVEIRWD